MCRYGCHAGASFSSYIQVKIWHNSSALSHVDQSLAARKTLRDWSKVRLWGSPLVTPQFEALLTWFWQTHRHAAIHLLGYYPSCWLRNNVMLTVFKSILRTSHKKDELSTRFASLKGQPIDAHHLVKFHATFLSCGGAGCVKRPFHNCSSSSCPPLLFSPSLRCSYHYSVCGSRTLRSPWTALELEL